MPTPVKAPQLDFLSNKNGDDFFLSDDSDDAFNFKYVSKSQFRHVIKEVRRRRAQKKEERDWLARSQDEESDSSEHSDYTGVSDAKRLFRERAAKVNQELRRSNEDSQSEIEKSTQRDEKLLYANEKVLAMTPSSRAGRIDALLTIPEEISSSSVMRRSPVSELKLGARRSRGECAPRSKSESPLGLNRTGGVSECESSSEPSGLSEESDGEDLCELRTHPAIAHKILGFQRKISELLDDISLRLNKIPRPDGERDLRRREQRVAEFAVRFSRNYLYDLGRQVADVNRHVRAIFPNGGAKPTRRGLSLHVQPLEQKLVVAHQLLLNALNAYRKHVPSSVLKGRPGKLKEILQVVVELRDVCDRVHLTSDRFGCGDFEAAPLGKDTQKRCSAILLKLRAGSDNESRLVSHTAQSSPIVGPRNKRCNDGNESRRNLPTRLSMYSSDPRLLRNPTSRKLAPPRSKERKSRDVPQTPPNYRPTTPERPISGPAFSKPSAETESRKKAKIYVPPREDEISTMMSTLATDSDATSSVTVSGHSQPLVSTRKCANLLKLSSGKPPFENSTGLNAPISAELLTDEGKRTGRGSRVTDRQLSSLVPIIAELMTLVTNQQNDVAIRAVPPDSVEALTEMLKKYRSPSPDVPCGERDRSTVNHENSRDSTRRSNGSRCGAKNVQLICIASEEDAQQTRDSLANEIPPEGVADRAQDGFATFRSVTKGSTRRTKCLRVGESSLKELLKYRHDFQSFSRSNPMYTSSSQNKPWEVVAWIADKLVDELIVDVSKEFQIEETIRELFALEFKEF